MPAEFSEHEHTEVILQAFICSRFTGSSLFSLSSAHFLQQTVFVNSCEFTQIHLLVSEQIDGLGCERELLFGTQPRNRFQNNSPVILTCEYLLSVLAVYTSDHTELLSAGSQWESIYGGPDWKIILTVKWDKHYCALWQFNQYLETRATFSQCQKLEGRIRCCIQWHIFVQT